MRSVAVQAGGQSRRMGRDKGLVPLAGRPLIVHLLDRVRGLADEVLVTTNRPQDYAFLGLRLASDPHPGAGALAGLHTALAAARGDPVLVLACDMPFVSPPLLEHLLSLGDEADAVIPRRGGEYEPLHAVYRRACEAEVAASLRAGQTRMISFLPRLRVRKVEEDEWRPFDPLGWSFFNVNTPEDLARAEQHLADLRVG